MTTINIDNKKFRLPTRLTTDQYSKVMALDWEDVKLYPLIISLLTDMELSDANRLTEEARVLAISLIIHQLNQREECKMLGLDKITFGQFIDLDIFTNLGVEKHINDIQEILCPEAEWADEVMWAIDKFVEFRQYIFRQYSALFGITDKDLQEFQQKITDQYDPMQLARSWYRVIVSLAGDDILKIDKVTDEPLKKVLNFMALQKEKQLEEQQRLLQQKRQNDIQRINR